MNKGIRNEVAFLLGAGSLIAWLKGNKKLSAALGLSAGTLALWPNNESFSQKHVVITGGSRGLGLELAKQLVQQGAHVALLARDLPDLEKAQELLKELNSPVDILIFPCDVTQKVQLKETMKKIMDHWNDVDMVVNNAGAIMVGPFDALSEEDFRAQMELHLFAVYNMVKEVEPIFRAKGEGRIVNICSMGGKVAVPHMIPYDASKFALAGFSQGIAAEFKKYSISVTTVYPAVMRTGSPIQAVFKGDHAKEFEWFATGDYMPGVTVKAEVAARKILTAALDRRAEIIFPSLAKLRLLGGVIVPELMIGAMSLLDRLMPKGIDPSYKTGAMAKVEVGLFDSLFGPTAEKVEEDLNQTPKSDAKFNLGLH